MLSWIEHGLKAIDSPIDFLSSFCKATTQDPRLCPYLLQNCLNYTFWQIMASKKKKKKKNSEKGQNSGSLSYGAMLIWGLPLSYVLYLFGQTGLSKLYRPRTRRLIWVYTVCQSASDLYTTTGCILYFFHFQNSYSKELTLVLLNPDIPCLCKQCRFRSVGFWRSQLIWICTVCH